MTTPIAAVAILALLGPITTCQRVDASPKQSASFVRKESTTTSPLTDTFVVLVISYVVMQIVLFVFKRREQHRTFERMQIPGPKPHFIHGHLYETRREPYVKFADRMHEEYGKNVGIYLGGDPYLITKDLDLIQQVFVAKSRLFYNRMNFYLNVDPVPDNLICQRGDRWRYMRKLLTPAFSNQKIRSSQFYRDTQRTVEKFTCQLEANKTNKRATGTSTTIVPDVYDRMAAVALDVIVKTAFHMDDMISFSEPLNRYDPTDFWSIVSLTYWADQLRSYLKQKGFELKQAQKKTDFFLSTVKRACRLGFNPLVELIFCFPFLDAPLTFLCSRVYFSSILRLLLERLDYLVRRPTATTTKLMANGNKQDGNFASNRKIPESSSNLINCDDDFIPPQQRRRIIDSLIEVLKERKITRSEFTGNAFVIVFAGFETTANALTFTLWLLAQNQRVQIKLRDELLSSVGRSKYNTQTDASDNRLDSELGELATGCNYLEAVINESLRLYPPVPGLSCRQASTSCTLANGMLIERNVNVVPSVYSIHRDKTIWGEQADEFIPERFELLDLNQTNSAMFMPFGLGPRNCIGKAAAMHELKIVIGRLVMDYSIEAEKGLTPEKLKLCSPINITITNSETIGLKFVKLQN